MFFEWVVIRLIGMDISFILLFDYVRVIFCGVVFLISGCVFIFRVGYMAGDLSINRFGLMVLMFVVFMILLILSPRFVRILLGWDGLGLVSYCLVIYYYNYRSYNAGMITGIRNRVGDVGILLVIGVLFDYG